MINEKYLIVSMGSIGRRHLRNLRKLRPLAQIGILRLTTFGLGEELPDGANIQFLSIDQALSFCPAAAILACPSAYHLQIAIPLVKAGIPLLIEKPIAACSAGMSELIEASRDIQVMVAYNLRFLPSLVEARRLLQSGAIGQILGARVEVGQYLPDWRPAARYQESVSAQKRLGGGVLLELSHEIDYLYWILGLPSRVAAYGNRYSSLEIDVEDMVSLTLEYDHPNMLVNVHLDFLQRAATRCCKFIGSEGILKWDFFTETISIYLADTREWLHNNSFAVHDKNIMYLNELSHFLEAVEFGTPIMIDARQGLQVLQTVEAAKRSIATRATVELVT